MTSLDMTRVLALTKRGKRKIRSFSLELFKLLLAKMDEKYNIELLPYHEVMRFSANELKLEGKERRVYLSAASTYFSQNRALRAAAYRPDKPPSPKKRRPASGTIIASGRQLAWNF